MLSAVAGDEMPIITISRGSYSKGREIAERVAERLEYRCISRNWVQKETARRYRVPEVHLIRAIHDAPSLLERLGYKREKYLACVQSVILRAFQGDSAVYHGLAGHFFVTGVSHVLKVRILADMEDRVRWEMEREGSSEKDARRLLEKDDEERRKWSKHLYGIDTWDPQSYDLVVHINKISVEDAVSLICQTSALATFQATEESRKHMDDLVLAAEVRAALVDIKPDVEVTSDGGDVVVRTKASLTEEAALVDDIKRAAKTVAGVKEVAVRAHSAFMDV